MSVSILGLVAIRDARDIETRLNEVEKLLKAILSMPCKVSMTRAAGGGGGVRTHPVRFQTTDALTHIAGCSLPGWFRPRGGRTKPGERKTSVGSCSSVVFSLVRSESQGPRRR